MMWTRSLCKCGHDHISFIGTEDGGEIKAKIEECEKCECERFIKNE